MIICTRYIVHSSTSVGYPPFRPLSTAPPPMHPLASGIIWRAATHTRTFVRFRTCRATRDNALVHTCIVEHTCTFIARTLDESMHPHSDHRDRAERATVAYISTCTRSCLYYRVLVQLSLCILVVTCTMYDDVQGDVETVELPHLFLHAHTRTRTRTHTPGFIAY